MKKSIALGITLTGIGAALFGAFSLYKLTKEEEYDGRNYSLSVSIAPLSVSV